MGDSTDKLNLVGPYQVSTPPAGGKSRTIKRAEQRYFRPEYTRGIADEDAMSWENIQAFEPFDRAKKDGFLTVVLAEESLNGHDELVLGCAHLPHSVDSQVQAFFESLIAIRKDDRRVEIRQAAGGYDCLDEACIQKEIVTVAYLAHRIFADRWKAKLTAVDEWFSHRVELCEQDVDDLTGGLEHCIKSINSDQNPISNEAIKSNLVKRLTLLSSHISEEKTLVGRYVEWLTDVAWYVLVRRQDAPPRAAELFASVSLAVNGSRPLGKAMARPDVIRRQLNGVARAAADALRPSLGFLNGDLRCREAAVSLATYTRHRYRTHRQPQGQTQGQTASSERLPPVIFVGLHGLEVEYGFFVTDGYFHVALPLVDEGGVDVAFGSSRLRWLVQTFQGHPQYAMVADSTLEGGLVEPAGEPRWLSALDVVDLKGPLIVKLNGSALHRLDEESLPKDSSPQRVHHLVAFDEFDLIQRIVSELSDPGEASSTIDAGLPDRSLFAELDRLGFNEVSRQVWFHLGHRLPDFSARLQLQWLRQFHFNYVNSDSNLYHYGSVGGSDPASRERVAAFRELGVIPVAVGPIDFLKSLDPEGQ